MMGTLLICVLLPMTSRGDLAIAKFAQPGRTAEDVAGRASRLRFKGRPVPAWVEREGEAAEE